MPTYLWPGDPGWTADEDIDDAGTAGLLEWVADPAAELDEDALCLHVPPPHLWDDLDPVERRVVAACYCLDGGPERTIAELHDELGLSARRIRSIRATALAKLRARLAPG